MKKILIVVILLPLLSFAQIKPVDYRLNGERISKINASAPKSNSILDVMVVGDTVWLGTSRGLSRSLDGGASWKNYYQTKDFGEASISAMEYGGGEIWISLGNSVDVGGSSLPAGAGLLYSKDNGETWTFVPQPLDDKNDTTVVYGINTLRALPVTTSINNITYDIAITEGTIWIASFAGGLRKSTDKGKTWERVVLPPDYLDEISPADSLSFALQPVSGAFGNENNLNHRLFAVVSNGNNEIWAGSAGGINKSTDGGLSWVKFNHTNQKNPISGNFITSLGYDTLSGSVWAASWKAEGVDEYYGVSRTTNGGVTWDVSLVGEKPHNFGFINYNGLNDVLSATDNGIFRSSNFGDTWFLPDQIIDSFTKRPFLTNVFYSSGIHPNNDNTADIWLGSDNGLILLKETGFAWEGKWKIFEAADNITENTTFAFPNPFAPGLESVKIKYTLNNLSSNVTIRIFDFRMHLVKTLLQNTVRIGSLTQYESWDGADDAGRIVPNGVYFYRIDISGNSPVYGKIMTLR